MVSAREGKREGKEGRGEKGREGATYHMPQNLTRLAQVFGVQWLVDILIFESFQLVEGDLELWWREGGKGEREREGGRGVVSV